MKSVAVVGSGPAALMVASVVAQAGHAVSVFEKKKGPGRKLLIAGSSGLNITNSVSLDEFAKQYTGSYPSDFSSASDFWSGLLKEFSPQDWIQFIEKLGVSTFKGSGRRYFLKDMKASMFLRTWIKNLSEQNVKFHYEQECIGFDGLELRFSGDKKMHFDAICFALGGGSYVEDEKPLRWPRIFIQKKLKFQKLKASYVGYEVDWNGNFLRDAEGKPIKYVEFKTQKGKMLGDLMVTRYGLEGTPVYTYGCEGTTVLDLKPDLNVEQILKKCKTIKENRAPFWRVKKQLKLSSAALALIMHMTPSEILLDLDRLAHFLKNFPVKLVKPRLLGEAISSSGGIDLSECDSHFMLKNFPGVFVVGEMLDWDAPTGGFLIQGCVSRGYRAGKATVRFVRLGSLQTSFPKVSQ